MPDRFFRVAFATACSIALLVLLPLGEARAQEAAPGEARFSVHAHVLQHRSVADARALVQPLLSAEGTLAEQGTTLVVRDHPEIVERVLEILEAFDHAQGFVELEIHVVRAGPVRKVISPVEEPQELPPELIGKFRGLLRYETYDVIANATLTSREGENVTWDLGPEIDVNFRVGGLMSGRRLRLERFQVIETETDPRALIRAPQELFRGTLNLWVDRPFTLVIADDADAPEALLLAITCRPGGIP